MAVRDLWHHVNVAQAKKKGVQPCKCGRGDTVKYPTVDHGKEGRWRVELYRNGKKWRPSEHYDDRKVAKKRNDDLTEEMNAGREPVDPKREKEPLRTHMKEYIEQRVSEEGKRTAIGSRRAYRSRLENHIMPYFGEDATLGDIGPREMKKFRDHLALKKKKSGEPYSASFRINVYVLLASALNYAVDEEKLSRSPSAKVKSPKAPDNRKEFELWEADLVKRTLTVLPPFDRPIVQVAATCGHRQGEAFGVCMEDIRGEFINVLHQVGRDEEGVLRLVPPKFNSVRSVPLPTHTARALAQHMREHEPAPITCTCHPRRTWHLVFSRPGGQPLLGFMWNRTVWHPALAAVRAGYAAEHLPPPVDLVPDGDNDTGLHQLRHHAISLWLYGGATLRAAANWAGHKSTKEVEMVYSHIFKEETSRARAFMDEVYGEGDNPPSLAIVS